LKAVNNPSLIRDIPLHVSRTGTWCNVDKRIIIIEPDFLKHTINSGMYIQEILYIFSS